MEVKGHQNQNFGYHNNNNKKLFCDSQNKESHTGLEEHEGE